MTYPSHRIVHAASHLAALLLVCNLLAGCRSEEAAKTGPQREDDKEAAAKLAELPTVKLVAISPHNTDIEEEYEAAFSLHHALQHGQNVDIEWRDVGGGGSAIMRHLRNIYATSDRSGIDIIWGGGAYNFEHLAAEGILTEMKLADDVRANIPKTFGGVDMYDDNQLWCGSAVSGFGFLYNKPLLERLGRQAPKHWEDLADGRFYDLVGLADPTQSSSAAASYEMIVQSADNWPAGWAKLLTILGNAKKFYAGAGDAAEALPSGEVAVATCIDFYGTNRVAKYPDTLVYVSPSGQTCFNPDPIAILKNPPHPELAQRFVDFALSRRGQALWALPAGHPEGPKRTSLGRQPIRKDVYVHYSGQLAPMIVNPYAEGQSMTIDVDLWSKSFGVLRQLVWAAAVKNRQQLRAAKKKLIDTGLPAAGMAEFSRLPDNVATPEGLAKVAAQMEDKKQADIIVTDWISFFREQYRRVAQ